VSNRISLLTTSTTSSIGVSAGTVTVTFPTTDAGATARRSGVGFATKTRPPGRFGCGQSNPIALAANYLVSVRVAEWQTR